MFSEKLVFSIKCNNQVLREFGDVVQLPVGSEYSIYVKNLNNVKCRFQISIDGTDIANDNYFIVGPNKSIEIERSIVNGNLTEGNKFKLIERTQAIEKFRGINSEDGLVKIEYEFEQPIFIGTSMFNQQQIFTKTLNRQASQPIYQPSSSDIYSYCNTSVTNCSVQTQNTAVVTAPGSYSNQTFTSVSDIRGDGRKFTMILKLVSSMDDAPIKKPVTVSYKPECSMCGKINKATNKFCSECGAGLRIK